MSMVVILQWNARSLLVNGQGFKFYLAGIGVKPDVVCIQETWLRPELDLVVQWYVIVRLDRTGGRGGGCATLVRRGVSFRELDRGVDQEYIVVEVWEGGKGVGIVNDYNPCVRLEVGKLVSIQREGWQRVVWCADCNAHSVVWGGEHTDTNGRTVEELMEERELVCLNDGGGTRIEVRTGKEPALDVTLVTGGLAGRSRWEVLGGTTVGSDHYPVLCPVGERMHVGAGEGTERWVFGEADRGGFRKWCRRRWHGLIWRGV